MTGLVDSRGNPLRSTNHAKPKIQGTGPRPSLGEIAPGWQAENRVKGYRVPLNNSLQFDTSQLKLSDYRMMRDHYQINSSLSVLMFMIHQSDWKIVGDDKKAVDHCQYNMELIWTRLIRAMSHSFWAGYSPCALQWENDEREGKVMLTKIKDLAPEDCEVKWKNVKAAGGKSGNNGPYATGRQAGGDPIDRNSDGTLIQIKAKLGQMPGQAQIFDGIKQRGYADIPVANSFWYPMLMEHGNFYGSKLLNRAYQSWFFSLLIHMYSNRYFERFGEPVPVARAPYDEEITVGGKAVNGNELMKGIARQFRNGSAVVLPNDRIMNGTEDTAMFEYSLEFLESQMRGADFDRYLQRLDEEIALSLFTPLLLNRTGSGGSFNLGVTHMQMFQWQINALMSDMGEYINKYILAGMCRWNFGDKVKPPTIEFRPQGKTDPETLRAVVLEVVRNGSAAPDLENLGQALGMKLEEVKVALDPLGQPIKPGAKPAVDPKTGKPVETPKAGAGAPKNGNTSTPDKRSGRPERSAAPKGADKRGKLAAGMADRIAAQFTAGNAEVDLGFWAKYRECLGEDNPEQEYANLKKLVQGIFDNLDEVYDNRNEAEDMSETFKIVIEQHLVRVMDNAEEAEAVPA